MKDLFGKAILDYQTNNSPEDLITETSISDEDEMSVSYLFRSFEDMPILEQKAMLLSKGKILDIGCGAGSHSLYLQKERNLEVTAIDISENAVKACILRGLQNVKIQNILKMESNNSENKFDTILLLMNGTGIFGTLKNTSQFLQKLKSLLNPNGQILIDSSDIIYMFDEDDEGAFVIPADGYYGELQFTVTYKGEKEDSFPWLYLDYNTLQNAANDNGLRCNLILEGEHYDYLAKLFI
ncbi:Methyltransferase domain-containing protein [Flavobacterium micromati]|uniref:Methyltransferase domain-containing protein n=1 Tax=Flavobacterium micromati TaxID=229205 RepID=A0A1M5F8G7_9FLAO|nr:methyltransferase domain-containing protein [Flavobacterium micromati]MCL6460407.1 class I SAM-dependent methyltransferase [Flavobacterium micromati]SHF87678.1 Methyltransferase domain-containing protein [Flavobacterium micromati]